MFCGQIKKKFNVIKYVKCFFKKNFWILFLSEKNLLDSRFKTNFLFYAFFLC